MIEIELLMIEFMLLIIHKIKPKMPMVEFGQLIFLKLDLDQVVSIMYTIFQLDITSNHPMVLIFQKEKHLIHISIT